MAHLTVVGGTTKPPFTVNSHGIAQYKLATRYGARRIVEAYAFPDETKPKIVTPSAARDLVYEYYRKDRSEQTLARAIETSAQAGPDETRYEKGRRTSILRAAKHLKDFGPTFDFTDVRRSPYKTTIAGLPVRVSLDFLASVASKAGPQRVGIIYNVATELADHPEQIKVHADLETEIAFRVLREHVPSLAAVWYIDLLNERVVKKRSKTSAGTWREIATVCDDILIAYRTLVARRSRGNMRAT